MSWGGEEHKLFVGGLSWDTTDDKLWESFSKFGDISFHRVCTDRDSGQSRGFGFVSFGAKEHADKAIAEMDGAEVDGRNIQCNMAQPKEAAGGKGKGKGKGSPAKSWGAGGGGGGGGGSWGEPEFKVFCGNLSWGTYSDELKAAFGECEGLTDAFVCTDKETQESRGFGFAKFDTEENMNKAVAVMNGKDVDGREINCNPARPKGEAGEVRKPGLCHAFQKGECWRGDDCKFLHEKEGEGGGDAAAAAPAPAAEESKQKKSFGDDSDEEEAAAEPAAEEEPKKKKKKKKKKDDAAEDGEEGEKKKKKKKKKKAEEGDEETPKKKKKKKKADAAPEGESPKKKKKKKKKAE